MPPKLQTAARRVGSPDFLIPAGLFVFAFLIRILGVRGWLPYVGHPDEPKVIDSAIHIIKTGDLNPHLYIWPSLYIYIEALVIRAHTFWGTLRGIYDGPQSLPDITHIFSLAPGVYVWARTFTAIVGAATVALMYVVARQMFDGNRRIGVIAALLIAVSPLHVEYSHFAITDVPLGFMGLMVLWASNWLLRTRNTERPGERFDPLIWRSILAGLLVGVATGTKYNGLYLMVVPLIAWFVVWRKSRSQTEDGVKRPFVTRRQLISLVAIPIAAAVGFILCEPYLILDWHDFYEGFTFQVRAYLPADTVEAMWASVMRHLTDFASSDASLLGAAALGSAFMVINPMARRRAWLLLPFPILYVLAMSRFSLTYVRNMIVVMPFLAIIAGFVIDTVVVQLVTMARGMGAQIPMSQARRLWGAARWVLVVVALLFVAWEPLRISLAYSSHMADPDSRTLAWNWMQERMKQGDRFAAELHPWQVQDWPDVIPFDVERPNDKQQLTLRPPDWYAQHGYGYVVLNGDLIDKERDPSNWPLYKSLREVQHFAGDKEGGKGPTISVLETSPAGQVTPMMQSVKAGVTDFAELQGYDLAPVTSTAVLLDAAAATPQGDYSPGQAIGLNLYYRALRDGNAGDPGWQVWIHLVDPATGSTVAQLDVVPLTGLLRGYPDVQQIQHRVSSWHNGEWIAGSYNIPLPATLTPGTYRLETGLWVPPNGPSSAPVVLGELTIK
ncbi:MAG: phospholipid carrier-dependent glycosyltransferase [Chloroflexota bacterium]